MVRVFEEGRMSSVKYLQAVILKTLKDKREVFLAVYEHWLTAEWQAIDEELSKGRLPDEIARRIVDISIKFHTEWRGLRASLMELIFADEDARKYFRKQRRRQLEVMSGLRQRLGLPQRTREQDAIPLLEISHSDRAAAIFLHPTVTRLRKASQE
jgi:AcrR family transcriptional regulator